MGAVTYPNPAVERYSEQYFIPVQFNVVDEPEVLTQFDTPWTPTAIVQDAEGREARRSNAYVDASGEISIVGEEPHLPYHRPPLSKDDLRGESEVKDALIQHEDWYRENKVEVLRGVVATALDTAKRSVTLNNGRALTYDRALV